MEQVMVYTTESCPWCRKAKAYLEERGVPFQEVNLETDQEAARRIVELTGQRSVPVLARGERYVVGFDPARIDNLLH
jgi:glutaredoxin-like YruB-family protein